MFIEITASFIKLKMDVVGQPCDCVAQYSRSRKKNISGVKSRTNGQALPNYTVLAVLIRYCLKLSVIV